jgi:hypothetical protein
MVCLAQAESLRALLYRVGEIIVLEKWYIVR